MSKLKSSEQIGEQLGLTARRVRQLADEGVLPVAETTPGRHRRFDPDVVAAAVALHKRHSFADLPEALNAPLLGSESRLPMTRRRSRRGTITSAMVVDAIGGAEPSHRIPLIGLPESSRFVIGQEAAV